MSPRLPLPQRRIIATTTPDAHRAPARALGMLIGGLAWIFGLPAFGQPAFTSAPPTDATVGEPYSYTMTAVYVPDDDDDDDDDDDEVALEFTAPTLPSWLGFDGLDTISGTPAASDVGSHAVLLRVRRQSESADQSFTITVSPAPNEPPEQSGPIPDQQATEGSGFSLATAPFFTDPDGDALTFSATGLPEGLAIATSGAITGAPAAGSAGASPYQVTITATDSADASASGSFTLSVTAVNRPPALAQPIEPDPQSATEGVAFSLATARFFTDPDGDALTFSATGLPAGLAIAANGAISGTPAAGSAGASPYQVTVTATDTADASASDTFTLNVAAVDRPPELARPIEPDPQNASEGEEFAFDIGNFFTDPDGDALTYSASGLPQNLTIDPSQGRISGRLAARTAAASPYSVTITASDGDGSASDTFTLNVTAANGSPVVDGSIPDRQAAEGEPFDFDTSQYFSDPDDDALRFSAAGLPDGLSMAQNGTIAGTPGDGTADGSPYRVVVTASDGVADVDAAFSLSVTAVDDPPQLPDPPPTLETREDTPLTVTPGALEAIDENPDALTVVLTPPEAGDDYTLSGGNTVNPAPDFNGTLTVEARVRDAAETSNAVLVTIDVTSVNDAPRIDAIPRQTLTEGAAFDLDVAGFVSDVEDDPLQYSASGLPPGLAIDAATGAISGTPPVGTDMGDYDVELTVDDGDATSSRAFEIALLAADRVDLEATVSVAPNPVLVDDVATWTLTARNRSDMDVANVRLAAVLSGDVPYRVDAVEDAACAVESRGNDMTVDCRFGPLAGGESWTVDVTSSAREAGRVSAVATVEIADAAPVDESPDNDEATAVLNVTERLSSGPSQRLTAPGATAVAAADLDGDGRDDLAVATGAGEPTLIFLGAFDSDMQRRSFPSIPISVGDDAASAAIASADLDDDGMADLIVAGAAGANTVLFNAGSASFEPAAIEGASEDGRAVAIGDVDGDALPDFVIAGDAASTLHRNLGSRQFAAAEPVGTGASADVAIVDLTGDGVAEVVVARRDDDAVVYRRVGGGSYEETTLPTGPASSVATADFDADGVADLAFGRELATDLVFLNTSSGGTLSFFLADEIGGSPTADLLLADFDVDGREDIVTIGATGVHQLYTHSGTATTTFLLHPEQFAGEPATGAAHGLFDGDERFDAAVVGNGVVEIFLNDGSGNFGGGNAEAPRLTLNGEPTVTLVVGQAYEDAGAAASDDVDGDLTEAIVVDNPVDTNVIGSYTVTYEVVDSAGNLATATRTVEVEARGGTGGGGGGAAGLGLLLLTLLGGWIRLIRSTT